MHWPTIEDISAMAPLADGYRYEKLGRSGIPALIDGIRLWHPDIAVGGASCYLQEDFYNNEVSLDREGDKDVFVGVFKRGEELVGMWSWEQVMGSENVSRAMGAQFQYGLATLKFPHVQQAFEHAGYRLLGLFPGYGREEVAPGVVKRVYEAVYAKLLVPEMEILRPDPKNMTPKTRALFDLLFPE